jgi:hypothetical protein
LEQGIARGNERKACFGITSANYMVVALSLMSDRIIKAGIFFIFFQNREIFFSKKIQPGEKFPDAETDTVCRA